MSVKRIEVIPMKSYNTETRLALLEQSIGHINDTLIRMEKRIEERFDKVDQRLEKMDQRLDKFNDRLWSNFYWLLATMFSLSCAGAGILAKGFHWLS